MFLFHRYGAELSLRPYPCQGRIGESSAHRAHGVGACAILNVAVLDLAFLKPLYFRFANFILDIKSDPRFPCLAKIANRKSKIEDPLEPPTWGQYRSLYTYNLSNFGQPRILGTILCNRPGRISVPGD